MPRKKTEELAIIVPETPVLPSTTEDAADQPLVGNTVPENTTEPAAEEILSLIHISEPTRPY